MPYQRDDTCNIIVPNSIIRLVNWKSTHKEFEKQFLDDSSEDESVWTGLSRNQNLGVEFCKKSKVNETSSSSSSSSESSSDSEEDQGSKTEKQSKRSSRGSSERLSVSEEVQSSNSAKKPPKSPVSRSSCESEDATSPNSTLKPPKSPRTPSEGAASPNLPEELSPSTFTGDSSKFEGAQSENFTEKLSNSKRTSGSASESEADRSLNLNENPTRSSSVGSVESSSESEKAPSPNSIEKPSNNRCGTFSESEEAQNPIPNEKSSASSSEYEDGPNLTSWSSENARNNDSSINNSLVNIDLDENDCVFIEDFEEDDEIFVLQCPKGIDLSSFKDKVVFLDGESSLKLKCGKIFQHYEIYAEKEDLGRSLNVVLPSQATRSFSIYTTLLAGSLVLSESMDLPEAEILIEPPAKIPLPGHLKGFFEETSEYRERNCDTTDALVFNGSCPDSIRKKKKKKRRNSNNESFIQKETSKMECLQVENMETIPKRKKKRQKLEECTEMKYNEVEIKTSVVDVDPNRIKKKKKK